MFKHLEYIPVVLITLLFIAETELEAHATNMSCQLCTTIIAVVVFYSICMNFKNAKNIALMISVLIWVILVYIKKNYILPEKF
jgi:hypothetical protein